MWLFAGDFDEVCPDVGHYPELLIAVVSHAELTRWTGDTDSVCWPQKDRLRLHAKLTSPRNSARKSDFTIPIRGESVSARLQAGVDCWRRSLASAVSLVPSRLRSRNVSRPQLNDARTVAAQLIGSEIRSVDTAYRYGGEELAIVMPHAAGDADSATAERIRALVSREFGWAREAPVSLSARVAQLGGTTETARDLIAAADAALYVAKDAGRDQVVLHPMSREKQAG